MWRTIAAMIREAGRGFDGEAFSHVEAAVIVRLQALLDGGVVHQISKNHLRAACTAELAKGKRISNK
jgi:hypothetical protein